MNFLLFTVPPLHSPVLEPDLHLKQQRNSIFFLKNCCFVAQRYFYIFFSRVRELIFNSITSFNNQESKLPLNVMS